LHGFFPDNLRGSGNADSRAARKARLMFITLAALNRDHVKVREWLVTTGVSTR